MIDTLDEQQTPNWRERLPNGTTRADILRKRHDLRRAIREWLDERGFIEIDAPLLVHGTTPDASIEPFSVGERYLVTSTEYQIKRMMAEGFERLYTLTQNFRRGDQGSLNNPEFTMLEWARAGAQIEDIETDAEQIFIAAAGCLGLSDRFVYGGREIRLRTPWERLSVQSVISQKAGFVVSDFELETLQQAAQACGLRLSSSIFLDRVSLFSAVMSYVEQDLGFDGPVFLRDWPRFQASSAPSDRGGQYAARSELIIGGIEVSDGFPFLIDHDAQREANEYQLSRRRQEIAPVVELDQRYLDILHGDLKPGAGMALGIDRLVMLLTDQPTIGPVLAFGWNEV